MTKHKFTKGDWLLGVDKTEIACADHPIADVTCGEWGDSYPSIRLTGSSMNRTAEAFMDGMPYGEVPREEAEANARLIRAAPKMLEALEELVMRATYSLMGIRDVTEAKAAIALALEDEDEVKPLYVGNSFNMPTLEAKLITADDVGKTVTVSGMNFYVCKVDGATHVNVIYSNDRYYASKGAYIGQYIVADGKNWKILSVGDNAKVHIKY